MNIQTMVCPVPVLINGISYFYPWSNTVLISGASILVGSCRTWANEMHAMIVSEDVASDLLGAELLIKHHEEYKHDIEKQWLKYEDLLQFGNGLVEDGHFMSMEVSCSWTRRIWERQEINLE